MFIPLPIWSAVELVAGLRSPIRPSPLTIDPGEHPFMHLSSTMWYFREARLNLCEARAGTGDVLGLDILLIGPPGSGKTCFPSVLPTIRPPLASSKQCSSQPYFIAAGSTGRAGRHRAALLFTSSHVFSDDGLQEVALCRDRRNSSAHHAVCRRVAVSFDRSVGSVDSRLRTKVTISWSDVAHIPAIHVSGGDEPVSLRDLETTDVRRCCRPCRFSDNVGDIQPPLHPDPDPH